MTFVQQAHTFRYVMWWLECAIEANGGVIVSRKWIAWFDEFGKDDVKYVGGKCANLGEMVKIGIPVPPGFAVTTEAYDKFLEEKGAGREIEEYLERFSGGLDTLADLDKACLDIGRIITSKDIPEDLAKVIGEAYDSLCQEYGVPDLRVAIRSSGVAEDMPGASFAGQYESYLNVRDLDDALEKIRLCWASMFSTRCVSYRQKRGLDILGSSVSVAVMKMIRGRSAGVGFTVHPTTGDDQWVVLEGAWGIGEAVVQGIVNPDTFVVNKEKLVVEEKRISEKSRQFVFQESGTAEADVPPEMRCSPCLSDEEAVKIAEYARFVESHYGVPQDIEWVIDSDLPFPENVFLVQTRPVTSVAQKKTPQDRLVDRLLSRRP